jgi:solute:Na+ symporter, SSS family
MVSFSILDSVIILLFFGVVLLAGFYAAHRGSRDSEDYLLSGRKVGLFLFVLTNVSTWYGGILGVGEFTYNYGILSWVTQGLPYYIFAIIFAFFFAGKIRSASLFTIPDKIKQEYGEKAGLLSAVVVFILVSPAPYLLMIASLISLVFNINIVLSLVIGLLLSLLYLLKGGFRADIYTDAVQFFIMFAGFIIIVVSAVNYSGGISFLEANLPPDHLSPSGGTSPFYMLVWFLIALWTFADPGFHQRCYAAKTSNTAKYGIIISVVLWALFDFLTTTTGLYSRAILKDIESPVLSFPLLAEQILSPGLKGLFYAALFATIMSTLNSFLFLSATTIGRDFLFSFSRDKKDSSLKSYTVYGLIISGLLAAVIAYIIPSVIEIWYTIGSLFIPGIILPVISAYYPGIRIDKKLIVMEIIVPVFAAAAWLFIRDYTGEFLVQIEPMLAGLLAAILIHTTGLIKKAGNKLPA